MADEREMYHLRLEDEDALLFQRMPDGTMRLRALSRYEWDDRVTRLTGQGDATDTDIVRQVIVDVIEAETAQPAGAPWTR